MFTIFAAALGITTFFVGWLVDWIDARPLMITGAAMVGVTFITASYSHSLPACWPAFYSWDQSLGPPIVGKLYDLSGSYSLPFATGFGLEIVPAFITWSILPVPGRDQVPLTPSVVAVLG